ncbi:MAG: hypothetical protein K0Q56_2257, partial [Sporolactobacillus laevolacticus]|nr:hypothetical protein [Sporolactobacillus laevolacticus]
PEQSEGQRLETLVGSKRLIALEQTTLLKGGFDSILIQVLGRTAIKRMD